MSTGLRKFTELNPNDRLRQDSLMAFPIIPLPDNSFPIEIAIDPKLTIEMDDNQSQNDWSFNFPQSPLVQPFDTPRISNGIISSVSTFPTSHYGGGDAYSFSHDSSPGYSFTASPSIGHGPATPPDVPVPFFPVYDHSAVDFPPIPFLDPLETQNAQSSALNQGGPAPGSPFYAPPIDSRFYYGRSLEIPGYPNAPSNTDGKRLVAGRRVNDVDCDPFGIRPAVAQMRAKPERLVPEEETFLGLQEGPLDIISTQNTPSSSRPIASFPRSPSIKRASPSDSSSFSTADKRCRRATSTSAPLFASDRRYCQKCKVNFQSAKLLEDHVKTKHARPFICVFHFAGCPARFEAKNEWKRHVSTKHVSLKYWLCLEGNCAQSRGSNTHRRSQLLPPLGSIFNRKDLYTQHVRRMHREATGEDPRDANSYSSGAGERLKRMQEGALRKRLELPHYMMCPVQECGMEFRGSNAWNERMEHVAQKHFDHTSPEYTVDVGFGGPNDSGLTMWASRNDVQIIKKTSCGWRLCEPLKGENDCKRRQGETCDTNFDSEATI